MNSAYAKHMIMSRPARAWKDTDINPMVMAQREMFLAPIQSPTPEQMAAYMKGYIDLSIKPWAHIKGSASSVRVSAVQQSIFDTHPDALLSVRDANLRLPEEMHLFKDPSKTEEDMHRLYIYLQNPQSYVASVEQQVGKTASVKDIPGHSAEIIRPAAFGGQPSVEQ